MKKFKLPAIILPGFIFAVLLTTLSLQACAPASCEVRVTAGKVDCDDANCPSPKKCVLQARKKNTELPWEIQSQPVESDNTMEYRCLCKK